MIVSLFVGIVPPIILGNFTYWLHNASVLLALCCPVPVFAASAITYFAGVGGAAAKGVLFKDKEAIDSMGKAGCVLFDKNGTLSTGRFVVTDIEAERVTGKELLELASYAYAKADNPLAKAIMANVEKKPDLSKIVNNYEEAGKCCVVQLSDGRVVAAGNEAMLKMMEMPVPENQNCDTVVYICVGRDYMGCIHLTDKFRSDAKVAVSKLRELEIANVAMVSSESKGTSAVIAKNLELDNAYMAYGEKEKTNVFDYLIKELPAEEALVYVGNGYDDPQLLEYTDVGVAMNGLIYENARKYSNVILVKSEPSGISTAVRYAKKIKEVCDTNAVIMTAATAMTAMLAIFGKVNLWTAALILGIAVVVTMLYARRAYSIKK